MMSCLSGPGAVLEMQALFREPRKPTIRGIVELMQGGRMNAFRKLIPVVFVAASSLTAVAARAEEIIIRTAPPARRHEVVIVRPGPNHIWIPGYWRWSGKEYLWAGGEWRLPPHPRAVWVPGGYRRRHGGWVWREGRWR
jgi:hypothetical protein